MLMDSNSNGLLGVTGDRHITSESESLQNDTSRRPKVEHLFSLMVSTQRFNVHRVIVRQHIRLQSAPDGPCVHPDSPITRVRPRFSFKCVRSRVADHTDTFPVTPADRPEHMDSFRITDYNCLRRSYTHIATQNIGNRTNSLLCNDDPDNYPGSTSDQSNSVCGQPPAGVWLISPVALQWHQWLSAVSVASCWW
ncbi:hypothetical protein Q8A73_001457 [Channa argus]|nr:hypothetical protein Q8A73_001457 [Channa argus]